MNTRSILIAYASRFGSTQEVAVAISAVLREAGLKVDLQPMQDVKSLDGYAAVVLGAAIYNAHWHADAHTFLSRHQQALTRLSVAVFTLGPLSSGAGAMANSHRQLDKELKPYLWLQPVALEVFAGKYDPSKPGMGFFEKLVPASDHRDWAAIHAWANVLAAQLKRAALVSAA